MSDKYLNATGLAHLWDKITGYVQDEISGVGGSQTTWYGTCSTATSTAAKVVTCENFTLVKGAVISILFTAANVAATPTLNVNSTGAVSIRIGNTSVNGTTNTLKWSGNTVLTFVYDGTYFQYLSARSAAVSASPDGSGSWYGTSSTAAATAAKLISIANYRLTPGARVSVTFSTANTVEGAITLNVNSTGAKTIYYNNAATSASNPLLWDAGETLTFVYSGSYYYFVARSKASAPTAMTAAEVDTAVQTGWGTSLANADSIGY